jgi:hypothetical protein
MLSPDQTRLRIVEQQLREMTKERDAADAKIAEIRASLAIFMEALIPHCNRQQAAEIRAHLNDLKD